MRIPWRGASVLRGELSSEDVQTRALGERRRVSPAKVNHAASCTRGIGKRRQRHSLRATVDSWDGGLLDVHVEIPGSPATRTAVQRAMSRFPLPLNSCHM